MIEVVAMGESLDLLMKTGMENILNESCRLAERLGRGLESLDFKVISDGPIVNFAPNETSKSASSSIEFIMEPIIEKLKNSKVSFARRGPGIRLSLHAYNRDSEVDRVLSLLEK
jgi:selenocysteine lyase/cysteine desulfurase